MLGVDFTENRRPMDLLSTPGKEWEFQTFPEHLTNIHEALKSQYKRWKEKLLDKLTSAFFLCHGGPGTGKSRLLEEFLNLCKKAMNSEKEILAKLQGEHTYVINTTFESGTSYIATQEDKYDPLQCVGARMLYHLSASELPWRIFVEDSNNFLQPVQVLSMFAQDLGIKEEEMTIILTVDGIQKVGEEDGDSNVRTSFCDLPQFSRYKRVKDLLKGFQAMVTDTSVPFWPILCASMTLLVPAQCAFPGAPVKQVFLPTKPLNPSKIFSPAQYNNPMIKVMIEDVGRFGRALEAVHEVVTSQDMENIRFSEFNNFVTMNIKRKYPQMAHGFKSEALKKFFQAILFRTKLSVEDKIPGTEWTVDELVGQSTLFYRTEDGRLDCPYIGFKISIENLTKQTLFKEYGDRLLNLNPLGTDLRQESWKQFETFCTDFMAFLSFVFDGNTMNLQQLHRGAKCGDQTNVMVDIKELTVVRSRHQFQTSSRGDGEWVTDKDSGAKIPLKSLDHIFLNGCSAPSGDARSNIQVQVGKKKINTPVVYQFKDENAQSSKAAAERDKACQLGQFFVIFSTGRISEQFSKNLGEMEPFTIRIDETNWDHYFGPFAKRARRALQLSLPLDINSASKAQL